ncbi:hypothetical protein [Cryptosporangium japonicum]|uniref:Abortive infection protein n=1 Tax=Cryptosporangium japonicum TaxID=80872 RepID=A0ABN0V6Q3_9ACTN
MRARGINYDTGFLPGYASRPVFDPDAVRRDLAVIAGELHCDAVRVSGGDPARLRVAAAAAAAVGLEVWYAPFPVDLAPAAALALLAECASDAEALRRGGAEVVFVAGCEATAFGAGFIPGDTYADRMRTMAAADLAWWQSLGPVMERFDEHLGAVAAAARRRFGGRLTYASAPWEFVDWSGFDVVGVDAYRAAYNRTTFADEIRAHHAHGKPVAVTEFGTCPYRGASERGGLAWDVPPGAVPDEDEQVRYLTELLDVFEAEGVDTALWFTFAGFSRVGADDLGSYGVVRMTGATEWTPRAAFAALAARYGARV